MAHAYQPRDTSQLNPNDPYGRYNCTAYSLARLIDYTTLGGMVGVTGSLIRALSDEPTPDPNSPGLNLRQCVMVAGRLRVFLEDWTGEGWAGVERALAQRRAVLLQLDAAKLPSAIRPWSPKTVPFPHATTIDWKTAAGYHWYDPVPGKDRYVTQAQIRPAAEALLKTVRFAVTRPVPWLE